MRERFVVTSDHLKLLQRMYAGWNGDKFGAPSVDPKQPYGSGDVVRDIASILGWKVPEDGWGELPDGLYERAEKLHREMKTVLSILLSQALVGIVDGPYQREEIDRMWYRM